MKLPYFPFYPGDWMKDPAVSMCSPATRGIWIDLICAMHELDRTGQVTGTLKALSRTCRCSAVEMKASLTELERTRTADVNYRNGEVTVICRRMQRAHNERDKTRLRVQKHRSNGAPPDDVTPQKRANPPPCNSTTSDSVSDSVSEEKTHQKGGRGARRTPTRQEWQAAAEMEGLPPALIEAEWNNQERKKPAIRWRGLDPSRLRHHARAVINYHSLRTSSSKFKTLPGGAGGVGVAFVTEKVTQSSKEI